MNQSQQLAHLMNNYSSTNEQVLQQYLASATTFPHSAQSALALHSMAAMNGSNNLLNNLSNFSTFNNLAAAMATQRSTALTSSPLSSTNSSTISSTGLSNQTTDPMFAALLQAQQHLNGLTGNLNGLNGLNASSLLQKYDQQNNNSQQSPSSASNCSSPPTCSSVTPPTPPPNVPSVNQTTLQLLAAQHYQQLPTLSTIASTNGTNSAVTNSVSSGCSNISVSLSETAAALLSQPNLSSLVANSQSLIGSSVAKRLVASPDTDANSNEVVDIQQVQQYYNQLNALRLLSSAGLTSLNSNTNAPSINNKQNFLSNTASNQPPLKDLARLYSAINYNGIADLNSPINSSLSSSSSSTNSLQNTMTSLQQQHTQMMAVMATGTFTHNSSMNLLSPNSISLKFSIENILKKSNAPSSLNNSTVDLATALNQQANTNSLINNQNNSPMSKLFEFNKQKNGLNNNASNKLSNFLINSTSKPNLEQCNSTINNLSSLVDNINPLDFKLNTSKRKKRSSSSMDDSCDLELSRSVKRKNSIDSDCSNSNSSISQTKLVNNAPSENGSIKMDNKRANLKSPDSQDDDNIEKLPTEEDIKEGKKTIPAWVFCTRYSDRPSSGFGLFGNYKVNSSWEAVKLLESSKVNLIKKQIDVIYESVDKIIPEIWQEDRPDIMLHVGVSWMGKGIVLETCAHSSGYQKLDVNKCTCHCEKSILANDCVECLTTELDVDALCHHLNELHKSGKLKLSTTISKDAGRYLCEYIYYSSLKCHQQKKFDYPSMCLFVHVPEINEECGFTIEAIREGLQEILEYLINEIEIKS